MRNWLLVLGAWTLLLGRGDGARAVEVAAELPALALADDVVLLSRADLDAVDLAGLQRTAVETLAAREVMFFSHLGGIELDRQGLRKAGVLQVVRVVKLRGGADNIWLFQVKSGADRSQLESTIKKMATRYMRGTIGSGLQFSESGPWLVARPESLQGDPPAEVEEHGARLSAAWKALGRWPGIAFVPSKQLLENFDKETGPAQATMPPQFVQALKLLRNVKWAAVAAKLDDKPALKLMVEMPEAAQASELAEAYSVNLKLVRQMMPVPSAEDDVENARPQPYFAYLVPTLLRLEPVAAGSQMTAKADSPTAIAMLDTFFVAPNRLLISIAMEPGHERLAATAEWLRNYRSAKGTWPRKLAEIKPLLGATAAEQDKMYQRLLTNPKTRESPSITYLPPAADFDPDAADSQDPVVLQETKDGKPQGWQATAAGDMMTIERGAEAK